VAVKDRIYSQILNNLLKLNGRLSPMLQNKIAVCGLLLSLILFSCKENTIQPDLTGTIEGQVLDMNSQTAIKGAVVSTSPSSISVITDENGKFRMEDVNTGSYLVSAVSSGYSKGSVNISVKEGQTASAIIMMTKSSGNQTPNIPSNPVPADGFQDLELTIQLNWKSSDPNGYPLTYDVYLFIPGSQEVKIKSGITDTTVTIDSLKFNTTYLWQVIAIDSAGLISNGPVWSFTTKKCPYLPYVFATDKDGNYEIYSTDGVISQRLTNSPSRDWWPRVNPQKTKIAFVSDRYGEPQIFTMKLDGSNIMQVTNLSVAGYHNNGTGFSWSSNGDYLLYSHYDKLYRINSDGSNLTLIASAPANRHFRECAWSSLNNKIAVLTIGVNPFDSEIYTMDINGGNMQLFEGNLPGCISGVEFSVDATRLMFSYDVSGYEVPEGRQLDSRIFSVKLDKSDSISVSVNKPNGSNDLFARFSPDGAKIIFANTSNADNESSQVWIMNSDGTNRKKIFESGTMPEWY
jgi:TolB protein